MSSSESDRRFLKSLHALADAAPMDDAEVDEILADAGIDSAGALTELQSAIAAHDEERRQKRFAAAEARRRTALDRLAAPRKSRTREELLGRLDFLQQTLPPEQAPQAFFRDLKQVPDEDLESLVEELEEMLEREED